MRPTSVASLWLPRDFVVASQTGGIFTIVTYCLMLVVFLCEIRKFTMPSETITTLSLDRADGSLLQVNFNIEVLDIECRNMKMVYIDEFGTEKMSAVASDFTLRAIDSSGRPYGAAFRPEPEPIEDYTEIRHKQKMKELEKEDGKDELDADWDSSHDGFKHNSFDHVIQSHDFVFINFFAGWCSHCRNFHPLWEKMAKEVNGNEATPAKVFLDRDGKERKVRMVKVNCVDFQPLCNSIHIDAYPTLRLYKFDNSFSVFEGTRREEEIMRWVERTVKMRSYGWGKDANLFEKGCNLNGHLHIPRVPGYLEVSVGEGDQSLNPTMTNVSHTITHLSFSDPNDGKYHRRAWAGLTYEALGHVSPLDGKKYITRAWHQAYQHYIKIVSTVTSRGLTAYQFQNHDRLSEVPESDIPQARFYFDIEPFSVWMSNRGTRWYDFGTSMLGILGGTFVVMRILSRGVQTVTSSVSKAVSGGNRRGGAAGGLSYGYMD